MASKLVRITRVIRPPLGEVWYSPDLASRERPVMASLESKVTDIRILGNANRVLVLRPHDPAGLQVSPKNAPVATLPRSSSERPSPFSRYGSYSICSYGNTVYMLSYIDTVRVRHFHLPGGGRASRVIHSLHPAAAR